MTTKNLVVFLLCICSSSAYQTAEQIARAQQGRGYYDFPSGQQNQPGRQYEPSYGRERDEQQQDQTQKGRDYYDYPQSGHYRPQRDQMRGTEEIDRDQERMPFEYGQRGPFKPKHARDWTMRPGQQQQQKQQQQVQYVYNLQTTTGIPGSSKQHSGLRMVAKLTWFNINDDVCLLKITEIKVGEIKNRPMTDPSKINFDFGSTIELVNAEGRQQDKLQLPIKFTCNRGNVRNIVFDAEDEPWSMNIKRGILNLFRVNLQGKEFGQESSDDEGIETLTHVDRMRKSNNDFFRIMEENVEGDCETDYNVMRLFPVGGGRHDIFNVTKSINLKACRKRPLIKYNFRSTEDCKKTDETCHDTKRQEKKPKEHFLKPTSHAIYTLLGSKNRFLITNAEFKSQYTFPLFNEKSDNIVTYVTQKIDMLRSNGGQVKMEQPRNPMRSKSGNIYSIEWDVAYEKHQMHDQPEQLRKMMATHDFTRRQDQAKFLLTNMIELLKKQKNQNEQYSSSSSSKDDPLQLLMKLIILLRTFNNEELDQISNFIKLPQNIRSGGMEQEEQGQHSDDANLMLSILPNVLAICGNKACVRHLVDQIRQNRFSAPAAALALNDLTNIQTPSSDIITELLKLAHEGGRQQPYLLKQTTWLVMGTLMNALCNGRNDDHWATEIYHGQKPCPRQLKERFVQLATERLQSSPKWEEALIYMKSLSNAGLPNSIPLLEKIITSRDHRISPMLKSAAIYALKKLPKSKANNIQKILTPLMTNAREPIGLRLGAANVLLQSNPDPSIFDQMINLIQNDKNMELKSFIYTAIKALSQSTNPCEKKIAQDAHLALQKIKKFKKDCRQFSKFKRLTLHDPYQNAGIDLEMISSFSNKTSAGHQNQQQHQQQLPQHLAFNIHSYFFGLWNKNLISLGVVSNGMDQIFGRAMKKFDENKSQNQPRGGSGWSLDDIWSRGFGGSKKSMGENDQGQEDMFSSGTEEYPDHQEQYGQGQRDSKGVVYLKLKDQNVGFLPISHEALKSTIMHVAPKLFHLERQLQNGLRLDLAKVLMLDQIFYKIPTSAGLPISIQMRMPAIVHLKGHVKASRASPTTFKAFKAMADMEFSINTNFMIDNEIWSPIINHGLRLDHKIKQYQPIKAQLNVDLNKEKNMLQLVVRQAKEKTNLLTLETAPVTYSNIWLKFVKNLDHPDEKVVPGEELSKTKYHVNKCFEELLTGGKMCLKGEMHSHMIDVTGNTPAIPLSGRNKLVLSIEPGPDAREDVVINLSAKILKSGDRMGLGDSSRRSELPGDSSSAQRDYSPSQKYQDQDQDDGEYLQHGGKNVMASKIRVEGSTPNRRFALDLFHMFDLPRGQSKFQMNFMKESRQSREPFAVCLDTDFRCQTCGEVQEEEEEERCGKCLSFNFNVNWGRSCRSNNFITARLQPVDQSSETMEQDQEENFYESGSSSLSSKRREKSFQGRQSGSMKQGRRFKLIIGYNRVPISIKNSTNKLYRYFKHHYFPQVDVAQINVRNPDNRITAWINVNPKNEDQSDIIVKMPSENSTFINIPTPFDLSCSTEYGPSESGLRRKQSHGFRKNEIEERPEEMEEEEDEEEPEEHKKPESRGWFGGKPEKNEDFFSGQQPSRGQKRRPSSKFARKTEYGYEKRKERPEEEDYDEKEDQFNKDNNKDFFGRKPDRSQYRKGGEPFGESPRDWFDPRKNLRGKKTQEDYDPNEEYEDYTPQDPFSKYSRKSGKRPYDRYQSEDDYDPSNERYASDNYRDEPRDQEYDPEKSRSDEDQSWFGQKSKKPYRDQEENPRSQSGGWFGSGKPSEESEDQERDDFGDDQEQPEDDRRKKQGGHGHLSIKRHHYDTEDYDWYDTCKKGDIRSKSSECPCQKNKMKRFGKQDYDEEDDTNESDQRGDKYKRPGQESDQWQNRYERPDQDQEQDSEKWGNRYQRPDQESDQWKNKYERPENEQDSEKWDNRYERPDQDSEKWDMKYNRPEQGQDQYNDEPEYYTQRKLRHSCNTATGEGCGNNRDPFKDTNEDYGYDKYNRKDREMDERRKSMWKQPDNLGRSKQDYWEPKDDEDWSDRNKKPSNYDDYDNKSKRKWSPEKENDEEPEEDDEEQQKQGRDILEQGKGALEKTRGAFKDVFEKIAGSKKQDRRDTRFESSKYNKNNDDEYERRDSGSWASEFTEDPDEDDDDPPGEELYPEDSKKCDKNNQQCKGKEQEQESSSTKQELKPRGTTCSITDPSVKTLDNVQYKFPISSCFTILTRDCSPNREFAVMMRKADEKGQTKEILMLTRGHKLLIKPSTEGAEGTAQGKSEQGQGTPIDLNGKKYMTQEDVDNYKPGERLIKVSQDTGKIYVEITKVGLNLDFDGQTVNLEFPNDAANKQCGLCGQSMDEKSRNPQNQWPNTNDPNYARQLFMMYVIKDARCLGQQQPPTSGQQQPMNPQKLKFEHGFDQSALKQGNFPNDKRTAWSKGRVGSQEYENEYGYQQDQDESGFESEGSEGYEEEKRRGGKEMEPIRAHGVMETGDQICISIIPLHKCRENSYPAGQVEKPVGYFCLSRNDPRAAQIRKQADSRQVVQGLENLNPTTTRNEMFPTKCIRV